MASGVSGARKLRRTLRRAPDRISEQVRRPVRDAATAVELDAKQRVPVDEGDLRASIEVKFGRDGLTAVVGPGARAAEIARRKAGSPFAAPSRRDVRLSIRNAELLQQFFKGVWIEFGTKGSPRRNIPPQPARPFMGPAADLNQRFFRTRVQEAVRTALQQLARGQ